MRRRSIALLLLAAAFVVACGGGKKQPTATPGGGGTATPTEEITLPLRPDQTALYSVGADGTGLHKLFDEGDYFTAALSPDGSTLAIMAGQRDEAIVYVLDADGGRRKEIARIRGYSGVLLWSPDSAQLAFHLQPASTDGAAAPPTTYLYSRTSGELDELFSRVDTYPEAWAPDSSALFFLEGPYPRDLKRLDLATRQETELLRDFDFNDLAISPDGQTVAAASFDSDQSGASGTAKITLLQAGGSGQRELLTVEETQGFGFGGIAWSPDGSRIAHTRLTFEEAGTRGTYIVDVATAVSTRLTAPTEGFDYGMTWSPDGAWLVIERVGCVQCDGGGVKPVLAAADGSGEVTLPGTDQFEFASGKVVWPPDSASFAYGGDRLYVAGAGGTAARPIADLPASSYSPIGWSDASTILFTRLPDAATAIYAAQPDGSQFELLHLGNGAVAPDGETVAELTEDALTVRAPGRAVVTVSGDRLTALGIASLAGAIVSWSPDGTLVAVMNRFEDGQGLAVADLDGKLTQITDGPRAGEVRWSPDGSRIAYWSDGALWSADVSGGEPRRIASVASAPGFDWSPRGDRIAFFFGTDVRVVSADGSGNAELIFSVQLQPYSTNALRWSPDGKRIAVSTGRDIAIGDAETRQVTEVATGVAEVAGFDWTSDGAALAFGGYLVRSGSSQPGVYLVAADGGLPTALTSSSGRRHEVVGRLPDGRIVFRSQFQL